MTKKIYCYLNSYSQGISGSDACFINFATKQDKFTLTVVTSALGQKLCQNNDLKCQYLITSEEKKFENIIAIYLRRTVNALRKLPNDNDSIVYSTSDFLPDVLPAFISKTTNRTKFWVQKIFHLVPANRLLTHIFQRLSFFLIKNNADLIIADSQQLKQVLVNKFSMDESKIKVITPGVDLNFINSVKPSTQKFDGIFVGQLRQSKGINDLVPIWKEVVKQVPNAKLAIIGKDIGGNSQKLKIEIREAKLERNIEVLGFLEKKTIISMIKSSKAVVSPSYEEGFGMVVAESLACNVAPVVYGLPAYFEHFKTGFMSVPLADKSAFANAVISAINSYKVQNLSKVITKFDIQTLVKREVALLEGLYEK